MSTRACAGVPVFERTAILIECPMSKKKYRESYVATARTGENVALGTNELLLVPETDPQHYTYFVVYTQQLDRGCHMHGQGDRRVFLQELTEVPQMVSMRRI